MIKQQLHSKEGKKKIYGKKKRERKKENKIIFNVLVVKGVSSR